MLERTNQFIHRLLAFLLAVLVTVGTVFSGGMTVHAADGTVSFHAGANIPYGDYFTSRMTFDGNNTAYCVEPLKKTPASGSYSYDLLAKDSPLRKALYYLNGGYGYEKTVKDKYFSGWSDDNSYVIGHLVVAYIYAGYSSDTGAFHGAPQSFIDKAKEVAQAIKSLPAPPENFRAFIIPGSGSQTVVGSWYQVPYGYLEIRKSSANASVSDGNSNYSLQGAEYGIYKGDELVQTLTTDKNGYAKSGELEEGNYTIKETKASKGFILDTKAHNVTVKSEATTPVNVTEIPQSNPMDLLLQKLDKESQEAQPQGSASLADAQFTVKFYTEQSDQDPAANGAKPARTWIFKTDAEGKSHFSKDYLVSGDAFYTQTDGKTICLPLGTVTVQETKAPTGYFANDTVFVQKITADGSKETVKCYNASSVDEQIYRGGVKIQKRDQETKKAEPQGSATLEGAESTITTLNEHPVIVEDKTYTKDQVVMNLVTDENGLASTAKDALPFGHYRVDETKSPKGYLNVGTISIEFDITKNAEIVELTAEDSSILNQVMRGDLELVKVSDGEQKRLSDIPFTITSVTTGESHTIVTDKNGYASTASKWNKHTQNTNRGETSEDGVWFGSSTPDDSKGALIYDQYVIEEQRCESNKGMNLLKFEVNVYKDSVTIDLGTLTDDLIEIGTTALDKETGTHMSKPEKEVTLVDTVEYSGLKKGQSYKLVGTLMDAETGETIQIDGKPVTSEKTFTAKKSSGTVEVSFTFDASSLSGKTTVVFEELYQEDKQLAVHADLSDQDQQISFPEIGTQAIDSETGEHMANADEKVKLIDTIQYKGLVPNLKYAATGTLMDAKTGEPVLINDKQVTAKTTFTPETSSGTVDVVFEFDGSSLAGKTTVVFESVTQDKKEIAVHADLEDGDQQIFFPEIATQANCPDTNTQMAVPKKELTITDTVSYHLIPNKEYKLTGTLMDKESGKSLQIDGKEVTSELTFTPEEAEGTVELSFTLDATALAGKTIVAFESVSYQDKEVAFHTQIDDAPQTIYFPEIKTTAKDGKDGDQEVLAEKETSIIDTVSYKDLVTGLTYRVVGTLMDKGTGKEVIIEGKPVTAETTFKADKSEGTVEVTFTFDATALSGHDVVVFEKLYVSTGDKDNKKEVELTNHEDLNDDGQTVKITDVPKNTPDISTPVKTGDNTPILLYAGIAAGALLLAGIAAVIYFRKKKQK
ncbi:VaFE repeat-containing surface-anchored protein [Oliverpabstia intestinalis]|uniref:VaFE repeat-containing surface-anchored protein n=1 Tax=Oliverpabstia intestinalis TaxID=2606633 RepID=UPI003F8A147A